MMTRLEDIVPGKIVSGLVSNDTAEVIAVKWYGNTGLEVTYKDTKGNLGNTVLYRDAEQRIEIMEKELPWSFDANGDDFRLTSEAYRIQLAHVFDPFLAVHTSSVEPLPHQISAVYDKLLSQPQLRYILADDPGAGKTIMTGLFIKELIIRGDLKRCLIVSPGSLVEQWQDELYRKFHLRFDILTNDRLESAVTGNIFSELNYCIARLDKLARNESVQKKLGATEWDLIVVDEAHKMSATVWGGEIKYTKRFQLGRLLSDITRHFLLLTATPHNGKSKDFQLFLSLIDPDRFEGANHNNSSQPKDLSDVMRRLVKEDLLRFDGTPLFPERRAYTVNYDLSPAEAKLYEAVTNYVEQEFNRADKLNSERKTTVGFALTILQRRLASSPEAIFQSLRRRRERLERRLTEERNGKHNWRDPDSYLIHTDYDEDDYASEELENMEENVADQASAATTIHELEEEIRILRGLERMASDVRASGEDRKWDELSKLLQENENMFSPDGQQEKLIIFTEHRDTLFYLTSKIQTLFGSEDFVVTIHGGMSRDERRKVEARFKQDKDACILIATDAAGEGINLQRAHLMVNYDLPWNPNRLEQRFGRIHRIGQTEVCHLWNLVSKETREGAVFQRLFEKLERERAELDGRVFDILGKITFDNRTLRDLLIEAIRYGNNPDVRAKMWQVVDHSLDREALRDLLEEHALTEDSMDVSKITRIRAEMERMETHKLQPHFIAAFFLEAFRQVGGRVRPREKGRYEITNVPLAIRSRELKSGFGEAILKKYERICFDKRFCQIPGGAPADLITPGHPLLEATIDLVLERQRDLLKRGTIFIDEEDYSTVPRLLFYIEVSIQDGVTLSNGSRRVISRRLQFVELREDGTAVNAGYAPYLDYRAAAEEESEQILAYVNDQPWLNQDVELTATTYAIEHLLPEHVAQVRGHKEKMIDKIKKAVRDRLTEEIRYWDYRASELKQKEAAGKVNARLNSAKAAQTAENLALRMQKRLDELDQERMISPMPPRIIGGALVIPKGLLHQLNGTSEPELFSQGDRKAVEYAAMNAVMEIERSLGFLPQDVSRENRGYDIESEIPKELRGNSTSSLRFIEVKGRRKGATTVTVSKNEILTGRNGEMLENYILAIVEVDGERTHTIYLKNPFHEDPDFTATSVNYDIMDLITNAEILNH